MKLHGKPGVEFIAFVGAVWHVSGQDRSAVETALAPFRNQTGLTIHQTAPSLEDVFVQLQERVSGPYG